MSGSANIDSETCWKLLGNEMFRECDRENHHFRCPAGEAKFIWLIRYMMIAWINEISESPRLTITKSSAEPTEAALACFAINFYRENDTPPERLHAHRR